MVKSTDVFIEGSQGKTGIHQGISHTLEPRTKLLILLLVNVTSFIQNNMVCEIMSIVLVTAVMLYHRAYRLTFKNLTYFLGMILLIGLTLTVENVFLGMLSVVLMMARKIYPTFMFAALLMTTTQVGEMTSSLQAMKIPRQVSITIVVIMRFFPTIKTEYKSVLEAAKIRGIKLNLWTCIKAPHRVVDYILVPLMMQLSIVAEELSLAAMTKGIDSDRQRTAMYQTHFGIMDLVFTVAFIGNFIFALTGGLS